jgi:hypothetical protein
MQLGDEPTALESCFGVVFVFGRPLGEFYLFARHILCRNEAQQMRDAVEPSFFLSSEGTMYQGACGVSVDSSISSRARV